MTIRELENGEHLLVVDRSKLLTDGRKALGEFLTKVQVYRSTADVTAAKTMFDELTAVDEYWLKLRDEVLKKRVFFHSACVLNVVFVFYCCCCHCCCCCCFAISMDIRV